MSNSSNTTMAILAWQSISKPVVTLGLFWWFALLVWGIKWACIAQMPNPRHWEFNAYLAFLAIMTGVGVPLITSLCVCIGTSHRQPVIAFILPVVLCGISSAGQGWTLPDLPERLKNVEVIFREPALLRAGVCAGASIILSVISMVTAKRFLKRVEIS